jgi:hypothetical protein
MRSAEKNGSSFLIALLCLIIATALCVLPWLLNRDIWR